MIGWINELAAQFSTFVKANPVIGGPLMLWALAVGTFALKSTPLKLWNFIKAQSTTTLIFDTSYNVGHQGTFEELMTWFSGNKYANLSRVIRIYFRWVGEDGIRPWQRMPVSGMSTESQLVFWERRPCLIRCERLGGDSALLTESAPYVVTITRLGRDRGSLVRLIETFRQRANEEKPIRRKLVGTDWMLQGAIRHRAASTVVTNDNTVEKIVELIRDFEASESWYMENGIPYKLCICLHGPPGTGKNSIVRAVASTLQRGIDSVALNSTTDLHLSTALVSAAGTKAFILFDDFDNVKFHARNEQLREGYNPVAPKLEEAPVAGGNITMAEQPKREEETKLGVTRQGLLMILDGEDTPHGRVFFMTTNDMSNLDSAITRPGRIDHRFLVGLLNHDSVRRYILYRYGEVMAPMLNGIRFREIAGSELESLYKQHPRSLPDLLKVLPYDSDNSARVSQFRKEVV